MPDSKSVFICVHLWFHPSVACACGAGTGWDESDGGELLRDRVSVRGRVPLVAAAGVAEGGGGVWEGGGAGDAGGWVPGAAVGGALHEHADVRGQPAVSRREV